MDDYTQVKEGLADAINRRNALERELADTKRQLSVAHTQRQRLEAQVDILIHLFTEVINKGRDA